MMDGKSSEPRGRGHATIASAGKLKGRVRFQEDGKPELMAEMRREAAFDALAKQVGFGSNADSRGLGADMLSDAPRRIAAVSRSIGIAAVLVQAKDDNARLYMACAEFIEYPDTAVRVRRGGRGVRVIAADGSATDAPSAQKPNETWNFPSQMSSPLWPKLR